MLTQLVIAMRPKQWAKNVFLFAALVFDRQLMNASAVGRTLAGLVIFCLLASAVYLINDLSDIEADREHPNKRYRPLAAGTLSPRTAFIAVGAIFVITLPIAWMITPLFFGMCVLYVTTNLLYSKTLKHVPLLDVLLLSSFYVMRVGAGVTLINVERFSPWLYLFTTFIALYLGIGKRRAELVAVQNTNQQSRRVLAGYTLPFLDQLTIIVSTLTIITYSLYTFSAENLPDNYVMMLTIPLLIYGIFRYLYLVQVENSGESPTEVFYTDRPLQIAIALYGFAVLVIFYLF
jgi:4-hydroxybenzoate polyprenyltransferase